MKFWIIFFFGFFTFSLLKAQPSFQRVDTFFHQPGSSQVYLSEPHVDGFGNRFFGGSYQGTMDFDPGPGSLIQPPAGSMDIFIQKYYPGGSLAWTRFFGGIGLEGLAHSLISDAAGNLIITGYFNDTVDFDPGPGVTNLISGIVYNGFVLKLDSTGNFLWVKQFQCPSYNSPNDVCFDNSGNILIAGSFQGTCDFDPGPGTFNLTSSVSNHDGYVCKLDGSGNFIWAKQFNGPSSDRVTGVGADAAGNIFLAGEFRTSMDADPGPGVYTLTSNGISDLFVCKLSSGGIFNWAFQLGSNLEEELKCLHFDSNAGIFITGSYKSTLDFDPGIGQTNLTSSGNTDIFLARYSVNGSLIWVHGFGSSFDDKGSCIHSDPTGNLLLGGDFRDSLDFAPSVPGYELHASSLIDGFLASFDTLGNYNWSFAIEDSLSGLVSGIAASGQNIWLTGRHGGPTDFAPGSQVVNVTPSSTWGSFLLELGPCNQPTIPVSVASADSICFGDSVTLSIQTGSLNSATDWSWYSQSCGNIPSGVGATLSIIPNQTTTYFVRAEGGCVTAGLCDSVTIYVRLVPQAPAGVLGDSSFCLNDTAIFNVVGGVIADSFHWQLPPGWVSPIATSVPSISVPVGSSGGYVSVSASNICGTSGPSDSIFVNVLEAPDAGFTFIQNGSQFAFTDQSTNNPNSWSWTFGDGNSSQVQNPSHTYSSSGNFQVCLISQNTCGSDTLCDTVSFQVGILKAEQEQILIFPNPATGVISIAAKGIMPGLAVIRIFDNCGREVFFSTQSPGTNGFFSPISLPLAPGIYSLSVYMNERNFIRQLIIR